MVLHTHVRASGSINRSSVLVQHALRGFLAGLILAANASIGALPAAAAPVSSCVPPPAGLLSWWQANGSTAELVSGRAGLLRNGATFAPGEVNQAFSFDGADQFVEVPDSPVWTLGAAAFTIDLWVKFNEVKPRDPFIGHDEGGGELNKWIFWYDESGHTTPPGPALRFHINSPTLGPIDTISVPWMPVVNTWYFVAVTRNGNTYALFLNGAQIGTSTNTDVLPDPSVPLTLGGAESFLHNGQVDEVEIFQRALSPSEIAAIFNAGTVGKCAAPTLTGPSDQSADEGATMSFNIGSFTDPNSDDSWTVDVDWGDGSAHTNFVSTDPGPIGAQSHMYADNKPDDAPYIATVKVTDTAGTSDSKSFNVVVENVAPSVTAITTSGTNAVTGAAATFTGAATDPSSADMTAGLGWQWSVDGGTYSASSTSNVLSQAFTSCGDHTVTARAMDKDGGVSAPVTSRIVKAYDGHFLAPLNERMYNSVQAGRVVPVKVAVACGGRTLPGLAPAIQLLKGNVTPDTEATADPVETLSVSAADTTGVMRDAGGFYLYNLSVPSDASATPGSVYTIRVRPFGDANPSAAMYIALQIK
jgi:Concanavalin A-like lectin/glucanases superfamily